MLELPDSGSLVQHGAGAKVSCFSRSAKANVSDRSTLVPERPLSPGSKRPISVHQGERQTTGNFRQRGRFSRRLNQGGRHMKKLLISAAVAAFAVTSAFAQATVSEYYVVRDATTKKCTIVDKKPTTTTTTVVDNGTFKTRTEAETGMKTMKVCTEN
jgi:hypothetical protein